MFQVNYSPAFAQQASIIASPKAPKTQGEILKEKVAKEAEKAKEKPIKNRTPNEHISVSVDTINKITENVPVVYSNQPHKINYMT